MHRHAACRNVTDLVPRVDRACIGCATHVSVGGTGGDSLAVSRDGNRVPELVPCRADPLQSFDFRPCIATPLVDVRFALAAVGAPMTTASPWDEMDIEKPNLSPGAAPTFVESARADQLRRSPRAAPRNASAGTAPSAARHLPPVRPIPAPRPRPRPPAPLF